MNASHLHPLMVVSSGGCYGGCLAGYCYTTYSALRVLLGEPHHRDIDDKVNVKWNFLCQDGTSFSVYDWKEKSIPKGYYWWHIGGGSPRSLEAFTRMTALPTVSHQEFHAMHHACHAPRIPRMTTTQITGAPLEDRIAIGTLSLEGYAPLAEHLKARLDIPDSVVDCAALTAGLRSLMLETPAPDQAQVTSGSTPQRDSGVPTSIR